MEEGFTREPGGLALSETKTLPLGALLRPHSRNKHCAPTAPRTRSPGDTTHFECVKGRTKGYKPLAKPRSGSAVHPSYLETSMFKLFLACVQDQIDLKANLHGGTS